MRGKENLIESYMRTVWIVTDYSVSPYKRTMWWPTNFSGNNFKKKKDVFFFTEPTVKLWSSESQDIVKKNYTHVQNLEKSGESMSIREQKIPNLY